MIDAPTYPYMTELLLRGATAGLCLLLAVRLFRRAPRFGAANLGALFTFGTAAYAVVSSPAAQDFSLIVVQLLAGLAMLNSVFFWWFATALFDDSFEWRPWRFAPLIILIALYFARLFELPIVETSREDVLQQMLIIAMMLHAVWLAVAHRRDDLVEMRRRFRLVFAGLVGVTGVVIAIAEIAFFGKIAPVWVTTFHATALFVLTFSFTIWIMRTEDLFSPALGSQPMRAQSALTIDDAARVRLEAAMENGAYRREGLTIAGLAEEISYPEYKLRQLINGGLGFRNFSAFLNNYRIAEAKRILSDPQCARIQITQVALDLGYGSIAPFNRAFKAAEGETPSAFRKQALILAAQNEHF